MDNLKVKYKPIFDSEKFDLIALINFFIRLLNLILNII